MNAFATRTGGSAATVGAVDVKTSVYGPGVAVGEMCSVNTDKPPVRRGFDTVRFPAGSNAIVVVAGIATFAVTSRVAP